MPRAAACTLPWPTATSPSEHVAGQPGCARRRPACPRPRPCARPPRARQPARPPRAATAPARQRPRLPSRRPRRRATPAARPRQTTKQTARAWHRGPPRGVLMDLRVLSRPPSSEAAMPPTLLGGGDDQTKTKRTFMIFSLPLTHPAPAEPCVALGGRPSRRAAPAAPRRERARRF